jgi:hypothetical protein
MTNWQLQDAHEAHFGGESTKGTPSGHSVGDRYGGGGFDRGVTQTEQV